MMKLKVTFHDCAKLASEHCGEQNTIINVILETAVLK
jgi:hypothetical protein